MASVGGRVGAVARRAVMLSRTAMRRSALTQRTLVSMPARRPVLRLQQVLPASLRTFKTLNDYHRCADESLETMSAEFEEIFDTYDQCRDFDVALANGVLTVDMADLGTYVINKQTPNQEIWFSSPLSGPKRFKYDEDLHEWRSPTETYPLHELLRREISELLQTPVDFIKPSPEWY